MEILSLGEKIKRRRKELNMTLKDLAGDRITPGQISLVESGKSNPSMDLLEYLAETLSTSIEYFMESEDTQAEKICKYYENIAESHIINDNLNISEQYIEKSLYYAEKYNLEYRKARNLYLRGLIYMHKGDLPVAQQYLLSSNVIFIKNNNYEEIVNTFVNLGKITIFLKAYHSSCSYFQQAEKVYSDNDIGNDDLLAEIYYHIAYTYFKLDNINKAIDYSYLAKEKYRQLNNKKEYANSLLLLSQQYSEKGEMDRAIKYSEKALNIFKEVDDVLYTSKIENNLGKLFYEFDNLEESFIHFNRAKEIRESNKDPLLLETLINICENYIKQKDIYNCKLTLDEIMNNLENGNEIALVDYYLLKHRVELLQGDLEEAESTLLMALNFVKNMQNKERIGEISIIIGKFYIDNGNDKEAAKYLNEGVEMFKEVGLLKDI
ncbi:MULTISPECIES: helix-turn-helix domain-containing protein [Clostridium]|jgi:transcriptional regulator with XRE-family HTH domain|uniref:Tetratricopeptide repeat protein n=2 Tax=Clostridium TaxID=1485 RepID=A0A7X5PAB2_CLOSG|nr:MULTISPECIES: tetratricopeptide repeat protein [Clostridium]AJD32736.1 helix-turn-helix family protein [Clostridium botulinum Prevot_594]AVP60591.1 transcriptional regulator [Clostridium botulinum]AKC61168.1 tetratricopeptide repeat/DNA binding domain-containing protein [Clostridium sporogenes]AKJ88513.1 XRE family transcriptional regulator [Clostridium sporogenes]AVP62729.1 transcriptional regulator [Clostridium botulinum]